MEHNSFSLENVFLSLSFSIDNVNEQRIECPSGRLDIAGLSIE